MQRPRVTALWFACLAGALSLAVAQGAHAQGVAQPAPPASSQACIDSHVEAQRARLRGELLLALDRLLACAQSTCPALISNDCGAWLREVEASLPSIVLAVVDENGRDVIDVTVSANGRLLAEHIDGKALPIDPGSYELSFEAPGYAKRSVAVTVRQAEKDRLVRVQLDGQVAAEAADEAAGGVPVLSYVLGGVAVAGLGAFAYFGLRGASEYDEAKGCSPDCSEDEVADGKLAYIVADIGLGVGLASAAAAVIVYVVAQPDERAEAAQAQTRIDVAPSRDGARVQWTSRF